MAGTTSHKLSEDLKECDEKRQDFLDAARRSQREFKRTGVAYEFEDIKRYLMAKVSGRKPRKPKPARIPKSER